MGFERRHAFRVSVGSGFFQKSDARLPLQLEFLLGRVGIAAIRAAAAIAARQKSCPARVLIAQNLASARTYYLALADHLGLPFIEDWPALEPLDAPGAAIVDGAVRLAKDESPAAWLVAPEGDTLLRVLRAAPTDLADVAITTPAHLAALIHYRAQDAVSYAASGALPDAVPRLSARQAFDARSAAGAIVAAGAIGLGLALAPRTACDVFGLVFFVALCFRLVVAAAGSAVPASPRPRALSDDEVPSYTVLVPLRQEVEVLPELLQALGRLDYPRAKLQVLLLIEPEDGATRGALAVASLPPWLQVVIGPFGGALRTKPRALNIGLDMARGELITVYDAEDRPDSDQLRLAAARFAADNRLACLQARLSIDRTAGSQLARLFAIEYAFLYRVFNPGIADLRLPMALGGTSNHFRVSTLRDLGGWDAWNVTEDADLGLRLFRFGHRVDCLDSTTFEAAPHEVAVWFKQRRRWMKGWIQTFLVIARDLPNVVGDLGFGRASLVALMLINLVVSPLALPAFAAFVWYDLARRGVPTPHDIRETCEATLAASVLLTGLASTLWSGWQGLSRSRRWRSWPDLILYAPYQLLIGAATLAAFWDLIRRPYHWHKTPHAPSTVGPMAQRRCD